MSRAVLERRRGIWRLERSAALLVVGGSTTAAVLSNHPPAGVAGISPFMVAAVSAGSVVMSVQRTSGTGPNLMIKAIAEREHFPMPSFVRYASFAFTTLLPAHLVVTLALFMLDR